MKAPVLEGTIGRRVLLNYRADPEVVQALLPEPLIAATRAGFAVVGVCLIQLREVRPKGLQALVGLFSENVAHRVAIQYPTESGLPNGLFIWRRDTDCRLISFLGGRAFPGAHGAETFAVVDSDQALDMTIATPDHSADVSFRASSVESWASTPLFPTLSDASHFFEQGDCGLSCTIGRDAIEGMQLRTLEWVMEPLDVHGVRSAFFDDTTRFPPGSLELDCGLLMRNVAHEWRQLADVPQRALATR